MRLKIPSSVSLRRTMISMVEARPASCIATRGVGSGAPARGAAANWLDEAAAGGAAVGPAAVAGEPVRAVGEADIAVVGEEAPLGGAVCERCAACRSTSAPLAARA
jgi:hypothetical protein